MVKLNNRIEMNRADFHVLVQQTKDDFRERLSNVDKFYAEQLEDMGITIDSVRNLARDTVTTKEKELTDMVHDQIKNMKSMIHDSLLEMLEERKASTQKYKKMFNDIKVVCSRFFEEYDSKLKEVNDKMVDMGLKYKSWSKVLIEPSSLNDARLFSLETRMQKEEDMRINEFMIMQDWVKKLLYALEQKSISEVQSLVNQKLKGDNTNDGLPTEK